MAVEKHTESLTLKEMKCELGENIFGYVFPQGDVPHIDKIDTLLKEAGGKPKECELNDLSISDKGKAKPEYIITLNDDTVCSLLKSCYYNNTVCFNKMHNNFL